MKFKFFLFCKAYQIFCKQVWLQKFYDFSHFQSYTMIRFKQFNSAFHLSQCNNLNETT